MSLNLNCKKWDNRTENEHGEKNKTLCDQSGWKKIMDDSNLERTFHWSLFPFLLFPKPWLKFVRSFAWNNDLFVLYYSTWCKSYKSFYFTQRHDTFARFKFHHERFSRNKFITSILWSAKMAKVSWISCNCSSVEMFVDCIVAMICIASLKSSSPFMLRFKFCFNSFLCVCVFVQGQARGCMDGIPIEQKWNKRIKNICWF